MTSCSVAAVHAPRSPRQAIPRARLHVGGRPPRPARRDPRAQLPRRSRPRDAPLVRMARPQVKMHRMCGARATSPVSSGPEPHDPPAILVEWSGPGTVPVSDLHSVARSGSGPCSRARSSRAARRGDRPPAWAASTACRQWIVHAFAKGRPRERNVGDRVDALVHLGRLVDATGSLATRHSIEASIRTRPCRVGRA